MYVFQTSLNSQAQCLSYCLQSQKPCGVQAVILQGGRIEQVLQNYLFLNEDILPLHTALYGNQYWVGFGLASSGFLREFSGTSDEALMCRAAQARARHAIPQTTMRYDDNRQDLAGRTAAKLAEILVPSKP